MQSFCSVSENNHHSLQNKAPVNVFQFSPAIFLIFFFSCGRFSNTKRRQSPNNTDKYPSVSCRFFSLRGGIHHFHASHSAKRSLRRLQTTKNFNCQHVTTFIRTHKKKDGFVGSTLPPNPTSPDQTGHKRSVEKNNAGRAQNHHSLPKLYYLLSLFLWRP